MKAVEPNANAARVWSFGKSVRKVATYLKANVSGFYSLNGEIFRRFTFLLNLLT